MHVRMYPRIHVHMSGVLLQGKKSTNLYSAPFLTNKRESPPGRKEKWQTSKPESSLRHRINDKLRQKCDSPFKFSKAYVSKMVNEKSLAESVFNF
ncbi:hypothetical protein POVWA1_042880 [Plasmodium ovale wallikeri]|uniref:Uncharacterized protein n=1 Tax=Plasmodium ovale wallikeri TaxID=864142 RepID=A0A1A8ZAF2_PLAOA|nr:hypothetical protein POVWA1_042880 [Plasmodium ovale wallikeri]